MTSDVTGATSHVANVASSIGLSGKAVEQFAVEGFVLQFVEDSAGLLFGEAIVAFAD